MTRAARRAGTLRVSGSAALSFKRLLRCMAPKSLLDQVDRLMTVPATAVRQTRQGLQSTAFTAAMSSPAAFWASPYSMRVLSR